MVDSEAMDLARIDAIVVWADHQLPACHQSLQRVADEHIRGDAAELKDVLRPSSKPIDGPPGAHERAKALVAHEHAFGVSRGARGVNDISTSPVGDGRILCGLHLERTVV